MHVAHHATLPAHLARDHRPAGEPAHPCFRNLAGYIHARRRLMERYGLDLRPSEIGAISRRIDESDPSCVVLEYLPCRWIVAGRLLVAVQVSGQWVAFVWCLESKRIVTALPASRLDQWRAVLCNAGGS